MSSDVAADPISFAFTEANSFQYPLDDLTQRLHGDEPVHWHDPRPHYWRPFWVISRWQDVRYIQSHPEVFSSAHGSLLSNKVNDEVMVTPTDPRFAQVGVLDMDPPDHVKVRRLVSRAMTPKLIAQQEPMIHGHVRECLDEVEKGKPFDFVQTVAVPTPLDAIAELLGVSVDFRDDFKRWSDILCAQLEVDGPDPMVAVTELYDFFEKAVDERRAHPREDMVTGMVEARLEGDELSLPLILMFCLSLLVAGNETTRHAMSGFVATLAQHPDQWAKLKADPSLCNDATEELLRWWTPTVYSCRTSNEDIELSGQKIAVDDFIYLFYPAANRDAEVWSDPYRLDLARPRSREHLAFGFGEHFCVGAPLARLELKVLLEELVDRYDEISLAGEPEMIASSVLRATAKLPVTFS